MSSRLSFFLKFRKNFNFFVLNNEPDTSQLPLNTNFAFATHSIPNEYCAILLDKAPPHIHVLIEVTKDCVDVVNKITSTSFVVPCLLSSFKHLILYCSKFHLSGPLMEKLKIAVNYNNFINNSTDIGGASLRRRLPQVCFASQTRSSQTQTDLITNVNEYGRLEIDSNTLFVKFIMEKKFKF